MFRKPLALVFASCLLAAPFFGGCSSESPVAGAADDDDDDDDDGTTEGNKFHFPGGNFTVPTGSEFYHCFFRDFDTGADLGDVGALEFAYTPGSLALHHIVIFSAASSEGNTDRACEILEDGWNPRYAGGTATDPLVMPDGVAMPVAATEHIVIQFHYVNAGEADIVDNTTVDITYTEPGTSFVSASLVVSGNTEFEIPAGAVNYEVNGVCNVPAQLPFKISVFGIWPHMHQAGTHFKIDATIDGSVQTLWDQAWDFGDQPLSVLETPIEVAGGDSIHTTCTYTNPDADNPITYGESSFQEMCFDFFFYYPSLTTQTLPCLE